MPNNKKHISAQILVKAILAIAMLLANVGLALADSVTDAGTGAGSTSASAGAATTGGGETAGASLGSDNSTSKSTLDRTQYEQFDVGKYLTVGKVNNDASVTATGEAGVTKGVQDQTYLYAENPTAAFIVQVINFITLTAASLSFLAVVVAGFMMMSSAGNESQRTKGLEILQKAIIGLVITLSAYFIVAFVQNLLFETVAK